MVCSAWSTSQATMTTQTATVRQPLARAVDSPRNGWKQERECTGAFCTPGLRSVRPYALDCRDFCIAMPVSYLSSDVFAVCKCLILLARWEPLTAWPVRSKHAAVAIGGVSCFAIGLLQAVGIGPTTEGEADALGYWVRFLYGAS